MKKNNDKRFDLALGKAHADEDNLAALLLATGDKIELKTEYAYWKKTGNICVEIQSYGKPSGISSTEATHWVHSLKDSKTGEVFYMIIETARLRKLVAPYVERGETIRVGDNNASVCVLIPISKLIDFVRGIDSDQEAKETPPSTPTTKPRGKGSKNPEV